MRYIPGALQEHYNDFKNMYGKDYSLVAIGCQGSQNYGTNDEHSDFDSKAIAIPNLRLLATEQRPISTTIIRENNEHTDVKDIRLFFHELPKMSINLIELLYTDYILINPQYYDEWMQLIEMREDIARYDRGKMLKCAANMAGNRYQHIFKQIPSEEEFFKEHGYNAKQFATVVRMEDFLTSYTDNIVFKDCIKVSPETKKLIALARGGYCSAEVIQKYANDSINNIDSMVRKTEPMNVRNDIMPRLEYLATNFLKKAYN